MPVRIVIFFLVRPLTTVDADAWLALG